MYAPSGVVLLSVLSLHDFLRFDNEHTNFVALFISKCFAFTLKTIILILPHKQNTVFFFLCSRLV